ncbi:MULTISPECIES: methylated-DNA--[protein]-cysteine S-methyltransferase [Microbacterium]|uniref:Methylated-DNA--[protein]-cysteine S-methyltransferase n=1 Tax=Microbacterium wangchenii TaxID=2541726 RepID=A0ABX5SW40_9MICO|nr:MULTISPECIES: methylated-DNA--[protein]-cysteine S-methyltransferase [Microbacterium]MCK6067626.1 methylated-DNA--[protein]-cysteine S-methyltransferase [Microbacterium sp. EYE_512]QBR89451.1 methylated-DNA--[protein]-cysteine S-methyltransferase [Microbacterium wangchenii]TFV81484.1 methylated-DNA--[protein]-cysteine S-methyltransferase [Microbacterium sp. dk485]TXK11124.1 methylated-DNA--[protein]-cysteine S-methyltransferase [Microbacterium wangchenii]
MTRYASAVHSTPVGDVLLTVADDHLLSLRVLHDDGEAAREGLVRVLGVVPEDDPSAGAETAQQLDEYFDGTRKQFDLALDWSLTRGFSRAALQAVCEIPYGETAAYGEVAAMAGHPRAARAVGTACATSPFSIVVPVHRVVRSDGSLGQYGGHPEVKQYLLRREQESGA